MRPPVLRKTLVTRGAKRGLGYQTMLKLIVREHLRTPGPELVCVYRPTLEPGMTSDEIVIRSRCPVDRVLILLHSSSMSLNIGSPETQELAGDVARLSGQSITAAALEAWWRFGRTHAPAALNFGACIAYGTASVEGESLLFKGSDFPLTDIQPA